MDFSLSDEQRLLQASAERFVRARLGMQPAGEIIDLNAIWRGMADLGLLALPFGEDVGGVGGSFEDVLLLMTTLGRGVVATPYVANLVACGSLLVAGGAANAHAVDLLGRLISGEARVALAERDGVGDPVRAVHQADSGFSLHGRKVMSHDAPAATALIVSARSADAQDLLLFLVDASTAGVTVEPYPLIDGAWAADISFDGVRLASDRRLLGADEARALAEAKDRAVFANLAQIVGCMEECLELCSSYLKVREQFGKPIGKFQALQHMMAAMFVDAQESRSILYYALSKIDAPPVTRGAAIAAARIVITEAGRLVGESGIQLHGGYGLTEEFAVGRFYKRIITLSRMFGDNSATT